MDNHDARPVCPVRRPNSNMYGLIVNEIGMRDAITELQQEICRARARRAPVPSPVERSFDAPFIYGSRVQI